MPRPTRDTASSRRSSIRRRSRRVPTLTLHGALDPVNAPHMSEDKEAYFSGPYERRLIDGAGHFPQRERAVETVGQVIAWLRRFGN